MSDATQSRSRSPSPPLSTTCRRPTGAIWIQVSIALQNSAGFFFFLNVFFSVQFQIFFYLHFFFCRFYRLGPVKCVDRLHTSHTTPTPPRNLAWSTRVWPGIIVSISISIARLFAYLISYFVFRTFEIWNYSISLISSWIRLDLRSFGLWRPLKWIVWD